MRVTWLLVLLLAVPIAAAQAPTAEAKPTLTLDPSVVNLAPSAQSETHALISNPLAREIVFNLTVHPSDGVKARLDRPQVRVPAGGSASVLVTTLVPNATNVTHRVEVVAKEIATPSPDAGAPIQLFATLELRVPPRPPGPLPPVIDVQVRPHDVEIATGGNITVFVFVHNGGAAPISSDLDVRLPPGLRGTPKPPRAAIPPGTNMEIPLLIEDDGTRTLGEIAPGMVGLRTPQGHSDTFSVRTVAAPVLSVDPAPSWSYLTSAAIVAGAAGTGAAFWLTRRHWWPLLLALYTRLRPSKILDHPVRRRIAEIVQAQPGISFSDLSRAADIAPGQLTHHARMLEKAGVVFSSPDGQTRRFFHVGAGRLASVPPLSERVLDVLRDRPRRASELAKELGVSRQALHYHVKHLVAEGKLLARADGREMWLEAARV